MRGPKKWNLFGRVTRNSSLQDQPFNSKIFYLAQIEPKIKKIIAGGARKNSSGPDRPIKYELIAISSTNQGRTHGFIGGGGAAGANINLQNIFLNY